MKASRKQTDLTMWGPNSGPTSKSDTVCNHGSLFPQSMPICIVAIRSERKGDNRTPTSQHDRLANSLIGFWPANRKGRGSSQSCKMHAETRLSHQKEPTCAFLESKLRTNLLPNRAHILPSLSSTNLEAIKHNVCVSLLCETAQNEARSDPAHQSDTKLPYGTGS